MWKKLIKDMLPAMGVSVLIIVVFGLYLALVGIPRTQARNLYNKGVLEIQTGNIREALNYFEQAIAYWPEDYIVEELSQLQQLSD